jgi:amidase
LQRTLEVDVLKQLALSKGISVAAAEEEQFKRIVEALLEILDSLEAERVEPRVLEAERDPGRAPDPGEDPFNAIVRWCRVRAGAGGILSGKRVSLKDSVGVAGIPLTCGSRVLAGFVPAEDSVVAERILRAGGEIVALTNMDDFAVSAGGESSFYGPTLNPFDIGRTAGGSSGGAAAALYYDGIDVSVGCDQGGSIRIPAAWCGVIGLKPTFGLVPYTGIVGIDQTFDHAGPMGRSSADVAALLQAIAGKDESDPRQRDVPTRDYVGAVANPLSLKDVTLGVVTEGFSPAAGVQPDVADAVEEALGRFAALGAKIRRLSVPEHRQAGAVSFATALQGMTELLESGGNGFGWRGRYMVELPAALASGLRRHADDLSAQVKIFLMLGTWLGQEHSGTLYAKAQNLRPALVAAYDRALADVDALLMPTTPGIAHAVDPDLSLADRVLRGWDVLANTIPADVTGHPALTIPAAETAGLPVGVMLVGPHFADDKLLSIAAAYERHHPWLPDRVT